MKNKPHTSLNKRARTAAIIELLNKRRKGLISFPITTKSILKQLQSDWPESEIPTVKTISRDINAIKQSLGNGALIFDQKSQSYCLTEDIHELSVDLSYSAQFLAKNDTASYLFLARQSLYQFSHTPFYEGAEAAFNALCQSVPAKDKQQQETLSSKFHFQRAIPENIAHTIWDDITYTLQKNYELRFTYLDASGRATRRIVQPLGLITVDFMWQLVAIDTAKQDIRTFRLSRISHCSVTSKAFAPPTDFDLKTYMSTAVLGYQSSGAMHDIHLRYSKQASPTATSHHWTSSQKSWRDENDQLNVSFKASALFRIVTEIISWAGHIEVIGPSSLKKEVCKKVAALQDAYPIDSDG